MIKRIILEVIGTQQIDETKDEVKLTTVGTIRDDDNAYIINYKEEQEPPQSPIEIMVRIAKDDSYVNMTRSGPLSSCIIIEKSKRNQCQYRTQFGDILMGINGKDIKTKIDGENGEFSFIYDIDINGSLSSKNTVKIKFKEKK